MRLLDACIRLAAGLPDPGQPTFVATCAGFGAFVGGVRAMCREGRDRIGRGMAEGSLVGYGTGFLIWTLAVAIDAL